MDVLGKLIYESVVTKIRIVESDETEKGDRKLLNFGHTFGHALEKLYHISHGEAVAIGMMMAGRLSVNLGMIAEEKVAGLGRLIEAAGLPVSMDVDPVGHGRSHAPRQKKKADLKFSSSCSKISEGLLYGPCRWKT